MAVSTTVIVAGLSEKTVIDWYKSIREECAAKLLRMPIEDEKLGRPGKFVEINKSEMVWGHRYGLQTDAAFHNILAHIAEHY